MGAESGRSDRCCDVCSAASAASIAARTCDWQFRQSGDSLPDEREGSVIGAHHGDRYVRMLHFCQQRQQSQALPLV